MWMCSKCGREFKRTNQSHFCGKAPETVAQYIQQQEPQAQEYLQLLQRLVLENVADVKEDIACSMPRYQKNGRTISIFAGEKAISLYVDEETIIHHLDLLNKFKVKNNTIYLPYTKKLPIEVLVTIIKESLE